ncbi:unnamed protein product [Adineta ricciae]|uniref:G-protein coupled receptors family 1 profile domain-containing protein n=1 Tax=Adineta ricciae TaxID=249248 RepID=A0A813QVW0_ADIRI|nr:unnamed protein product [Adineta ricciae]CAF1163616.1 unnamed protein product [Adineta ricciae]
MTLIINPVLIRDICLLLLYTFTSFLALIGNGVVFRISFLRKRSSHLPSSTTSILLLNLAFADGLSGLAIPLQFIFCSTHFLYKVPFSSHLCVLSKSTQILAYNASTLTMCIIAYDRYRLIQNPLRQYSRRNTRQPILFTWFISALFASSCLISMKVHTYFLSKQKLISCQILFPVKIQDISSGLIRKIRVFCLVVLFYIIPLVTISILCCLTMRTIARRTVIGVQQFPAFKQTRTRSIRLLIIMVLVFALSHLPVHFLHIRDFFVPSLSKYHTQKNRCNASTIYLVCYWLGISSCCHNPIIYSWFNRRFRTVALNCFRSIAFCGRQ